MAKETTFKIMNIVCIVLVLILLIGQFIPFWTYGDEPTTISMNDYVWNSRQHKAFTKELKPLIDKRLDLTEVWPAVAFLFLGVASFIFLLINPKDILGLGLPLVCGLIGIFQFLGTPIFRLGQNWVIHLVLFAVLTVVAVLRLILKPAED